MNCVAGHVKLRDGEPPRMYLYDTHAGGVGLAECAFGR
jgi:hypothetical protein